MARACSFSKSQLLVFLKQSECLPLGCMIKLHTPAQVLKLKLNPHPPPPVSNGEDNPARRTQEALKHPLVLRGSGKYRCNGCGCAGAGLRYRCDACDFNLHELCATSAPTAQFFFHGQHPLTFEPAVADQSRRCCDICGTQICGMHYGCRPCAFDVHPVCSQLPAAAVSPLHPEHLVMLTVGGPAKCARCGANCVFRYCCGACNFNLHPKCLLGTDQAPLNIPKI